MARVWAWRGMVVSLAMAVVACGQTARSRGDADDGTAGQDNVAGMHGGGAPPTPQGGAGADPPMMGGAPNEPVDCSALANEPAGQLTVRIVNDTSSTIYLGQTDVNCVTDPLYRVYDGAGKELGQPSKQCSDCSALAAGGIAGCNSSCPQPLAVELAAGEALEATWAGLFSQAVEFPAGCGRSTPPAVNGTPTCWRSARVQPGTYVFSATAGKAISCAAVGGVCQPCLPREGGGCATHQATVPDLSLTVKAEAEIGAGADLGHAAPVELVFSE